MRSSESAGGGVAALGKCGGYLLSTGCSEPVANPAEQRPPSNLIGSRVGNPARQQTERRYPTEERPVGGEQQAGSSITGETAEGEVAATPERQEGRTETRAGAPTTPYPARFDGISDLVRRSYRTPCTVCGDTLSRSMWRGPWWDWCCTRCSEYDWRLP